MHYAVVLVEIINKQVLFLVISVALNQWKSKTKE